MICDVCGRDNAERLTFCQDCGRRLQGRSQRVAAPTPPAGLDKIELPAPPPAAAMAFPGTEASAGASGSAPPSARLGTPAVRQRPEAPAFTFAPGSIGPVARDPAALPVPAASHPMAPGACGSCGGSNPPGYRFCVTCGAPLAPSAAPRAVAAPAPAAHAPPAAAAVGQVGGRPGEDKIVGSPVVDIAATRQTPAKMVTCPRCSGQCTLGTRFCKYCGAPLDHEAAPEVHHDHGAGAAAIEARPAPAGPLPPRPPPPSTGRVAPPRPPPPSNRPVLPAPPPEPPSVRPAPPPRSEARSEARGEPRPGPPAAPLRPGPTQPGARSGPAALAGAPGAPTGRLVVIVEDGSEGQSFPLLDRQVDVGRTEGDVILGDDHYVSPRHARFAPTGGRWALRDLESTNRVFVRLRRPHVLRDGDLLLLGLEVLQFHIVSESERQLGHAIQHGTLLFGSPASPRLARLSQRTIEGVTRDVHHLVRDETIIGRETGDIVFTADPFLSRRHASIRHSAGAGEFVLTDLDSSNGTYVAIRDEVTLASGDFVRIGQHLFRVDFGAANAAPGRGEYDAGGGAAPGTAGPRAGGSAADGR